MRSWDGLRASDAMSAPVIVIERSRSLEEALRLLTDEDISGAPVVNHRGEPVGVVSRFDILSFLAGLERVPGRLGNFYFHSFQRWEQGEDEPELEDDLLRETFIDDVMTPDIISVAPEASLDEVSRLLVERRIHRVLVAEEGRIAGVVTTLDLLAKLAGTPRARAARASRRAG